MRILALITDGFGSRGGIAQYNRDFISALSSSNQVQAVVVIPRIGGYDDVEGSAVGAIPSKVTHCPPTRGRGAYAAQALRIALSQGPFDLVFCGHIYIAPLAQFVAKILRKPMWLQVHGIDVWNRPSRLVQSSLESADLVTAVSRYTRSRVLQWAALEPHRIRVLPNTVRFAIEDVSVSPPLAQTYPFSGKPYLVTVARINKADYYKGHARVIAALPELIARYRDLQYVIIGEGDAQIEFEQQARKLGFDGAIHFMGHLPADEVKAVLHGAQAFIMPSTKEGFGIVFLEAAACGVPVIGGNKDGTPDALADGAIGKLIDPEDQSQLVAAVGAVLDGHGQIPKASDVRRFSPENFNAHVSDLLMSLVGQRAISQDSTRAASLQLGVALKK